MEHARESNPRRRLFAVVSWGNAGTHWLAKLLNAHPDVFCVHALRNKLEPRRGPLANPWLSRLRRRWTGSIPYMDTIAQESYGVYALAGDVHGVPLPDVAGLTRHYGDRIRYAVLVRHPITRVRSHMNASRRNGLHVLPVDLWRIRWSLDAELRELLDTKEKLFFAHVVGMADRVREEVEIGPVFTLEQLISDRAQAQKLLGHLSAGELSFPPQVFHEGYAKPVVSHSPDKTTDDPEEIFAGWESWKCEAFRRILSPEARAIYEDLGCELSFLGDS